MCACTRTHTHTHTPYPKGEIDNNLPFIFTGERVIVRKIEKEEKETRSSNNVGNSVYHSNKHIS